MQDEKHELALEDYEQLVVLELAGEYYGVDIGAVNTIIRMQEVTEVPKTEEFVEGVINLRGSIVPVIDLRKRFCLPVGEITKASRIAVVEVDGKLIGMIVDAVVETLRLPASAVEPPAIAASESAYVRGIGKDGDRLVILLDLPNVLQANMLSGRLTNDDCCEQSPEAAAA